MIKRFVPSCVDNGRPNDIKREDNSNLNERIGGGQAIVE